MVIHVFFTLTLLQDPQPAPLPAAAEPSLPSQEALRFAGEDHFGAIRRLTASGENAEGYLSFGGDRLVYQSTHGDHPCDQIFVLDLLTGARERVSTGTGRTTCAYFLPGDQELLFASTHGAGPDCPPAPDHSQGYVWKIYAEYDLYVRDLRSQELRPLAAAPGYDAEATVSPDGQKIVFTSRRHGDLDLYVMNVDGSEVRQITSRLGYDGGAFFSPDSRRLVFRAYYPETAEEQARYQALLDQDSIEPVALQIMVCDLDGGNVRQVTDNGAANFAPYFHPDGRRIIYSSNQLDPKGRDFDLFLVRDDGSGNERVTFNPSFDGFPMFSRDGRRLVFASNRLNTGRYDTNLFLAEWRDQPHAE